MDSGVGLRVEAITSMNGLGTKKLSLAVSVYFFFPYRKKQLPSLSVDNSRHLLSL